MIARTQSLMDRALPSAAVEGYQFRIAALELPDPDDRHVLAALLAQRTFLARCMWWIAPRFIVRIKAPAHAATFIKTRQQALVRVAAPLLRPESWLGEIGHQG